MDVDKCTELAVLYICPSVEKKRVRLLETPDSVYRQCLSTKAIRERNWLQSSKQRAQEVILYLIWTILASEILEERGVRPGLRNPTKCSVGTDPLRPAAL